MRLKLQELLDKHRLSQIDLAEALKTSRQNISHWVTGERFPTAPWLDRLAAFFEIKDLGELIELDLQAGREQIRFTVRQVARPEPPSAAA